MCFGLYTVALIRSLWPVLTTCCVFSMRNIRVRADEGTTWHGFRVPGSDAWLSATAAFLPECDHQHSAALSPALTRLQRRAA